jgi:LPS export ABC transporter protein LptC
MPKKTILLLFLLILNTPFLFAQAQKTQAESDQQISDFSLAGYGEKGKKSWDISGKSADIFSDVVKLDGVEGNLYGTEEDVKLTAKKGDFNKTDGKVHLEQDVVVTTSSGAKLTTDSLDWDRKNQLVSTQDTVNIEKDNMVTVATGAMGEPNLKKVSLEKDVKVELLPEKEENSTGKEKITITCDGPLEINYEQNLATFNNNVKVERPDSTIYSDSMEVYFRTAAVASQTNSLMGSSLERIVAKGNVKIVRGENISYSNEAVYTALDKKIVLKGSPRLVIYSEEDLKDAPSGN